jgi:hypothetical protein
MQRSPTGQSSSLFGSQPSTLLPPSSTKQLAQIGRPHARGLEEVTTAQVLRAHAAHLPLGTIAASAALEDNARTYRGLVWQARAELQRGRQGLWLRDPGMRAGVRRRPRTASIVRRPERRRAARASRRRSEAPQEHRPSLVRHTRRNRPGKCAGTSLGTSSAGLRRLARRRASRLDPGRVSFASGEEEEGAEAS